MVKLLGNLLESGNWKTTLKSRVFQSVIILRKQNLFLQNPSDFIEFTEKMSPAPEIPLFSLNLPAIPLEPSSQVPLFLPSGWQPRENCTYKFC